MNFQSWILLAVIAAAAVLVIVYLRKNKGKNPCSSCSGNCAECHRYDENIIKDNK